MHQIPGLNTSVHSQRLPSQPCLDPSVRLDILIFDLEIQLQLGHSIKVRSLSHLTNRLQYQDHLFSLLQQLCQPCHLCLDFLPEGSLLVKDGRCHLQLLECGFLLLCTIRLGFPAILNWLNLSSSSFFWIHSSSTTASSF
jgi:hypothetical protein